MIENLKEYIKELEKEYDRCKTIDYELTKDRSPNYYYYTRLELIREIIDDLKEIIGDEE